MDDEQLRRIANSDQGVAGAKDFASMVAAFYKQLTDIEGVEPMIAMQFTLMWLQSLLHRGN